MKMNIRHHRILISSIATLVAAHSSFGLDATLSSGAFTGDADSGVSSTKTYTAIANIIGGDVVVNGATFVGSGTALSGTGWELLNTPNIFGSSGIHQGLGGAAIANLFDGFQYNGNPASVTLSGLTAGQTYVATFYNQAWGLGDNRTQLVTSAEGAGLVYNEDALPASLLKYTFVATGETTTLNFQPQVAGNTMHFYGLSNEQVFTNAWVAGSGNWGTAANWSSGAVPDAIGANASFGPQAGPTDVFSASSRTIGFLEFKGTGAYNLEGSIFRMNAGAGGTAVIKTDAAAHTINASVQLVTDTAKFGAGTLTLSQEVYGSRNLTVSGGTLRFGAVNSYTGSTNIDAGATLDPNGISQTFTALNNAGTLLNNGGSGVTATVESGRVTGTIADGSGTVGLTKTTNGTLTLSGTQTYSGPTTIAGGTLRLQGTSGETLLADNFTGVGTPNTGDVNFNLAGRQTGTAAVQNWTPAGNVQVGNSTYVQQPAGVGGDYLLLAFGGSNALVDLPLSTGNVPGPVKISFDMFKGTIPNGNLTEWTSFTLRGAPGNGFPVTGSGELGFLYRANTGIQVFSNGGLVQDLGATTGGDNFAFYLTDNTGTGSPFAGNGTKVVLTQGGNAIGAYTLPVGLNSNTYLTFGSAGSTIGGVDNLAISQGSGFQTNVIAPTSNVALTAGSARFQLNDVYQTVASLNGPAGTVVDIGPLSRLTVNNATANTYNGTITGFLGSLVKEGAGVLEVSGANSYGAGTTITAGTILSHHSSGLGTGNVSIAAGANYLAWFNAGTPVITNNFTLNGLGGNPGDGNKGAIYADGGGGGYSEYLLTGSVTLASTSDVGGNNANNLRVLGQITGPGGLIKGSGRPDENSTLTIGNTANDFEGNLVINNGTVRLGTSEVIPHGAGKGRVIVGGGTTLDLAGNSETINNLSGLGTITTNPAVTILPPVFFTDDLGTGIDSTKTYTHALDFAEAVAPTINGVPFTAAGNTGANWSLTGATAVAGSGATGAGGDVSTLLTNFFYNGNPATLTLTGLTAGTSYELRLYQRQWGGDRTNLMAFNSGPSSGSIIYNQDISSTPSYLTFRYVADASGTATLSTTQLGAGTYHWYGLTNEQIAAAAVPIPVLTVGDENDSTYSGTITGELELHKVGDGTLTLDGALDFNTLNAEAGTVQLATSAVLDSLVIGDGAIVELVSLVPAAPPEALVTGAGPQAVPEPGTLALLLGGLLAVAGRRRRS